MGESSLFQGIKVYVSGDPDKKVLDLLTKGKGTTIKFTMETATHVLCGKNYEESHVQEARELYEIPVVNEQWIFNCVRLNKLAPTRPYAPNTAGKLFHSFIFTMTLIEPQDRLKLFAMITMNGGSVQKDLDNKVTHLISGGTQSVALKVAGLTKMKIITPDWVVECLKAKKLLETDAFHPNLLISPIKQQSKITLMTGDIKGSPSAIRSQLQQTVRPARPMVVQMQHTPQQINEIIQSQIQKQQMEEQAKQRAAQAASTPATPTSQTVAPTSILIAQGQQSDGSATNTTSILLQKQHQTHIQQQTIQQPQQQQQQVQQTNTQQIGLAQMNPINQQSQSNQPQMQRQISLPQQPTNINQMKQFQQVSNKMNIGIIQQQQTPQQIPQQQATINPAQQAPQQQFTATQVGPQQQQQQQFIMKQQQSQGAAGTTAGGGSGYIQIIQQGKQIIQIQHPDGGQMHQKNFAMQNQQAQQIQLNQAMQQQNPPNVTIQQTTQMTPQNVNIQQQSQPIQAQQQQQQPQPVPSSPIQQQTPRQNIVIINQLQNPQNPMAIQQQRFQTPQPQFQKTQMGTQQIIQQKLLTSNEGIVHQQQPVTPQNEVPNIVHIQQQQQPQQQPQSQAQLTQAQAVLQIAQQLQSGTENVAQIPPPIQQQQQQQQPQINQFQQIPQSPTQQLPPQQGQTVVQQHIITTNQAGAPVQQFIRTTGPRPIFLDSQSSLQFQQMNQAQRQEYLEQLHNKQQQQQRGVMFQQQQRAGAPNAAVPGQRAQHHIVIRSQVPPGLTPQQQLQWLQQQRRQILIRPPINQQQQIVPNQPMQNIQTQIQVDPNATPQQQQLQRQQQFQRLQQIQQQQQVQQKMAGNVQTPVSPRGPGFIQTNTPEGVNLVDPQQMSTQQIVTNDGGVSSSKTKTALANMLSNRLGGNNGNVVPIVDQSGAVVEQSAAGTLRMMTAQHNASLNVQGMPPVRNPQELIVLQQQQQQQAQIQQQMVPGQTIVQTHQQLQQRRTLGNITNAAGGVVPSSPVIVTNQMPPGAQVVMPQSPSTAIKGQPFSPGRAPPPQIVNRPQFYGHNPNLKLPQELFLLGCHFLIVEYDETNAEDLADWRQSIKHHGGEIESCYNLKVTHVLCRTQKHGIVMQAIRDNKRCVTAYWLNDIILKKQVIPPWQAIHFPSSAVFGSMKPGMKHIITISGFENDERERIKRMIEESGAKLTTYLNRQNTVMVCKRLDQMNKKFIHAKEFNIPMVNVVWLSDLLLGNTSMISQFESPKYQQYTLPQPLRIDHTILPQLMNSWKAPINLTQEDHERLKRSQMEPPTKRAKKMRTIPLLESIPDEIMCVRRPEGSEIPVVMFSHIDNVDGLTRAVLFLGGRITEDRNEMTHLVMTKPNRTIKLMYALCRAKYVLKSSWLEESAKLGHFQPEDSFWVTDLSTANFKCEIPAVVKSASRSRLFENRVFYITPSVKPAPSYLRWLIEQSGGKWEHNRRSVMKIHELNQQNPNSYIVISCPEDLHLLGFKHYVCYVATSEFIMQSIMTQTIDLLKSELQLSR